MSSDGNSPARRRTFARILITLSISALGVVLAAVLLLACFYVEENWRGKRRWENCRHELNAKGPVLDWNSYVPAAVPAEQNIFEAPYMKEWFARDQNELYRKLGGDLLSEFLIQRNKGVVAEIEIVLPNAEVRQNGALLLNYDSTNLTMAAGQQNPPPTDGFDTNVIPLIVMDEVPIIHAINNLANQRSVKYSIDFSSIEEAGTLPAISARWENVTASEAMAQVLSEFGLELVEWNDETACVKPRGPGEPVVRVHALAYRALKRLVGRPAPANDNGVKELALAGAQGYSLLAKPRDSTPIRIYVRAEKLPDETEVARFLWPLGRGARPFVAKSAGSNLFLIFRAFPKNVNAEDYLAWSKSLESDFDAVRNALRRPLARLDGDHSVPFRGVKLDFVTIRMLAQVLSQRAQCHLLLGESREASDDLTLLHQLPRILDAVPLTLVNAMISVAIEGIYESAIADGLRLHQWRERELMILQEQLRDFDLLFLTRRAVLSERAATCGILQTQDSESWLKSLANDFMSESEKKRISWSAFMSSAIPRGWIFANMAEFARLDELYLQAYHSDTHEFSPTQVELASIKYRLLNQSYRPYTFIAALSSFDQARVWRTAAHRQAVAQLELTACALERFHLARGSYPESLPELCPAFLQQETRDPINGQYLHYRRNGTDHFILYSVGWNEKDDDGAAFNAKGGTIDREDSDGDWVWEG